MNGCSLKKFIQTSQDNLGGSKNIKILKLSTVLSVLSRVHLPTILNLAPYIGYPTRIPLDTQATAYYKQGRLLEYTSEVTAKHEGTEAAIARLCVKAISI